MKIQTQPQLLNIPIDPHDVVYTPEWVARDMIEFFNPQGEILEPARGDGAIYRLLPARSYWCEISEGVDFFRWSKRVDWIISNPPFSAALFNAWLEHSYNLAPDIVYLLPIHFVFRSASKLDICKRRGWIKHARFYGTGTDLHFPMGNPIAAMHFCRGYFGPTTWSWFDHGGTSA